MFGRFKQTLPQVPSSGRLEWFCSLSLSQQVQALKWGYKLFNRLPDIRKEEHVTKGIHQLRCMSETQKHKIRQQLQAILGTLTYSSFKSEFTQDPKIIPLLQTLGLNIPHVQV